MIHNFGCTKKLPHILILRLHADIDRYTVDFLRTKITVL